MSFDYAPAPESTGVVRIAPSYGLFVDGDFVEPASGSYVPTLNPATEEELSRIAEAGREDLDAAVAAARAKIPSLQHGRRFEVLEPMAEPTHLRAVRGPA